MSVIESWLPAFIAADKFFTPCATCSAHHSAREATLNFWDINRQQELCSICLHDYPRENVVQVRGDLRPTWWTDRTSVMFMRRDVVFALWSCALCVQVRRSSYHDVVKVSDFAKLADITNIQSYVINGSKVVFLKRRPQPRPPKGAVGASQCVMCARHLQDVNLYCSLQCKLDGEMGCKPTAVKVSSIGHEPVVGDSSRTGPETPHLLPTSRHTQYSSSSDSDYAYVL